MSSVLNDTVNADAILHSACVPDINRTIDVQIMNVFWALAFKADFHASNLKIQKLLL